MFAAIMWWCLARLSAFICALAGRADGEAKRDRETAAVRRDRAAVTARVALVLAFLVPTSGLAVAQQSLAQQSAPPRSAPSLALPPATHQTDNVRSELISALGSVAPGERFWVALRQTIRPGWHTYWENPGDSGMPAQFTWTLPDGAHAGPINWPAPRRFPVGPLMNYGYADQVLLLVEIATPPQARAGERLDLQLDASWLVCAEICIPEDARLAVSIPIASGVASADSAAIAAARAALPTPSPWAAVFAARGDKLLLRVDAPGLDRRLIREAYFFARDGGALDHAAPQALSVTTDAMTLSLSPAEGRRRRPPEALEGVLELVERTGGGDTRLVFTLGAKPGAVATPPAPPIGIGASSLWQALLFALLGGVVLNLMPCVFPVLSMKALALVGGHAGDPAARRRDALGYALGVIASFAAIAVAVLAMRGAGEELGWGFQFQSPLFVAVLCYVMLAVGLNLSGVFDVSIAGVSSAAAQRRGGGGAFFTGLLAVVVATPCTAPFMGAALGVALTAEAPVMVAILLALGTGFAAPFVILALAPGLASRLPRPGAWMIRLKQLLAFPMYATAAWLLWVLSQQVDSSGLAWALAGLLCIAIAAWLYGISASVRRPWPRVMGVAALAAALAFVAQIHGAAPRAVIPPAESAAGIAGEPYSVARLDELRREGRPVLVNMTAAWCITCLFNERSTLASQSVHAAFAARRVAYLKGDWTNRDAAISAFLRDFGRSGVPLYVVYLPGREPVVLPQILTESTVLQAIGAPG